MAAPPAEAAAPAPAAKSVPPPDLAAERGRAIIAALLKTPSVWERLRPLTDTIGARIAGSEAGARAVAWAKREFEKDGVSVRLEPVREPVWVRGQEGAEIVAPSRLPLPILGLGRSVGTAPGGITAPVVVVGSYEELAALGREKVEGKIVLYDKAFPRDVSPMEGYGAVVKFRGGGASAAARLGAVAALVRSAATSSLRTPHTGVMRYAEDAPKIPAAGVSIEDAMLIRRLTEAGHEVRVHLQMGARTEPDRDGANVVAELRGRERPEEIVLIGAHLDSWDVGAGAIDDGAGCAIVLETMRLLAAGTPPRRTVRAVLFADEESGLLGGAAYRDAHKDELDRHVAAFEADAGGARALDVGILAGMGGVEALRARLEPVLAAAGKVAVRAGSGGSDISVLEPFGVPGLDLGSDTTHYFDWHHTMADTLDKVDPVEVQQAAAVFAATTWILAESDSVLPRIPPPAPAPAEPGRH
jgi:Iap family predicted aminopeptidase